MEVETVKLKLKQQPSYKQMNEVMDFQRYGNNVKIVFHHKDKDSDISITASSEEQEKILSLLRSRNLI